MKKPKHPIIGIVLMTPLFIIGVVCAFIYCGFMAGIEYVMEDVEENNK